MKRAVLGLAMLVAVGCDDWAAEDEPPALAYPLESAPAVARTILSWYGETDMTLPTIYGVPEQRERCGERGFWHPGAGQCLMGSRSRKTGNIYLAVPARAEIATYGHSGLCHELAHLVLARDGDSDNNHSALEVWENRSGPESWEGRCWRWVLASPGLNLEMR